MVEAISSVVVASLTRLKFLTASGGLCSILVRHGVTDSIFLSSLRRLKKRLDDIFYVCGVLSFSGVGESISRVCAENNKLLMNYLSLKNQL